MGLPDAGTHRAIAVHSGSRLLDRWHDEVVNQPELFDQVLGIENRERPVTDQQVATLR